MSTFNIVFRASTFINPLLQSSSRLFPKSSVELQRVIVQVKNICVFTKQSVFVEFSPIYQSRLKGVPILFKNGFVIEICFTIFILFNPFNTFKKGKQFLSSEVISLFQNFIPKIGRVSI